MLGRKYSGTSPDPVEVIRCELAEFDELCRANRISIHGTMHSKITGNGIFHSLHTTASLGGVVCQASP